MKKTIIALVAALGIFSTPAMAQSAFSGPRVEVNASTDDVTNTRDRSDISYGAAIGLDAPLTANTIVGVEATIDDAFDKSRVVGVSARAGVLLTDNVLAYGKVGYENFRSANYGSLDGLRLGAGLEANVRGPLFVKAEYRYSDLSKGVGRHGAVIGAGLRF
jgi:outer membrane immunogenic protein